MHTRIESPKSKAKIRIVKAVKTSLRVIVWWEYLCLRECVEQTMSKMQEQTSNEKQMSFASFEGENKQEVNWD